VETRPGEPVKVPLAQVTLGSGTVRIVTGKNTFPAKVGYVLGAGDTLELEANAWVTLALATNDHVVRLDDELTLKIEGLAMLKATKQTRSYKEQLDAVVTPKEQEGALRLAGWHASQMAANLPQGADEKESKKKPVAAPSKVPSPAEAQSKPNPQPGGPIGSSKEEAKRDEPRSTGEGGGGAQRSPAPAPPSAPLAVAPLPAFVVDAALTACVDGELSQWGPAVKRALGTSVVVKARRRDGVLQVRLGVGLATPPCVKAWVERHLVSSEWQSLFIPLK
jgi:hypothetical protein